MLTVITNNVPRFVVYAWELTESEREQFSYLDLENGEGKFFRYMGSTYDIGEFELVDSATYAAGIQGWEGIMSDSFFSGIVMRFADGDCDSVVVGRFSS